MTEVKAMKSDYSYDAFHCLSDINTGITYILFDFGVLLENVLISCDTSCIKRWSLWDRMRSWSRKSSLYFEIKFFKIASSLTDRKILGTWLKQVIYLVCVYNQVMQ